MYDLAIRVVLGLGDCADGGEERGIGGARGICIGATAWMDRKAMK